jgi:hypothetical protein
MNFSGGLVSHCERSPSSAETRLPRCPMFMDATPRGPPIISKRDIAHLDNRHEHPPVGRLSVTEPDLFAALHQGSGFTLVTRGGHLHQVSRLTSDTFRRTSRRDDSRHPAENRLARHATGARVRFDLGDARTGAGCLVSMYDRQTSAAGSQHRRRSRNRRARLSVGGLPCRATVPTNSPRGRRSLLRRIFVGAVPPAGWITSR